MAYQVHVYMNACLTYLPCQAFTGIITIQVRSQRELVLYSCQSDFYRFMATDSES